MFDRDLGTEALFDTQNSGFLQTQAEKDARTKGRCDSCGFFGNLIINIPAGIFLVWLGIIVPFLGAIFVIGAVVMGIRYLFTGSTE